MTCTALPPDSLPPRLTAGDALARTVQTQLTPGAVVFLVLTGVIAGTPTRYFVGGTGAATTVDDDTTYAGLTVAADASFALALASTDTLSWLPGRYDWAAFSIDPATGNRDQFASGTLRIVPNPAGTNPADPRSYNEKLLHSIRCTLAGAVNDDITMYKVGNREITRIPRLELLTLEAVIEGRVKRERRRKGQKVPSDTIGIRFGGG